MSMDMGNARRNMLRGIVDTDRELTRIYKEAGEALQTEALQAKPGGLTQRWKLDMMRSVNERMREVGKAVATRITQGATDAAHLPSTATADWVDKLIANAGIKGTNKSFRNTLTRTSDEALQQVISGRAYLDGKSLSKRIWTQIGRQQQGIQGTIEQAIAQKKSAGELAKDLHSYLSPDVKETPDASYYAKRLARTSINHAYTLANREAQARNPFASAMHWQLSPSHYERQVLPFGPDICDEYAAHDEGLGVGNWPIRNTPLGHPCCLCAQYPVVPQSLKDCAKELRAWLDGADNPKLEEGFGAWKGELALQNMGIRATMTVDDDTADKRLRLLGKIAEKPDVKAMNTFAKEQYFRDLYDASETQLRELAGVKLHRDTITYDDRQLGIKTGKHAADWGLDASKAADRETMRDIITGIVDRSDEIRRVDFSGQADEALAYIKGADVVLVKQNGKMITVMKDGATNKRLQRGVKTDGWIWKVD